MALPGNAAGSLDSSKKGVGGSTLNPAPPSQTRSSIFATSPSTRGRSRKRVTPSSAATSLNRCSPGPDTIHSGQGDAARNTSRRSYALPEFGASNITRSGSTPLLSRMRACSELDDCTTLWPVLSTTLLIADRVSAERRTLSTRSVDLTRHPRGDFLQINRASCHRAKSFMTRDTSIGWECPWEFSLGELRSAEPTRNGRFCRNLKSSRSWIRKLHPSDSKNATRTI